MTKYAGSDLVVEFDDQVISDHGGSLDIEEDNAAPDVTSFGDNDGGFIGGGVVHRKATFDGFDDSAGTIYGKVAPGTTATLEWWPRGVTAGYPALSATAIVTKRSRGFKIGDKASLKVEFQITGAVTAGVVPAP